MKKKREMSSDQMNKGTAEVKATEGVMKRRCVLLGMCKDRWIHAAHLASLSLYSWTIQRSRENISVIATESEALVITD